MGSSTTPKYALRVRSAGSSSTVSWSVTRHGAANDRNVVRYLDSLNSSMMPGGCNEHLVAVFGEGAYALSAELRINDVDGEVVASGVSEVGRLRAASPFTVVGSFVASV